MADVCEALAEGQARAAHGFPIQPSEQTRSSSCYQPCVQLRKPRDRVTGKIRVQDR